MKNKEQALKDFFEAYTKRFNDSLKDDLVIDVEGVKNSFASYFVESSPVGVNGGENDLSFKRMIPQGFEHYKQIGTQLMEVKKFTLTELDEFHWMAKVYWHSVYKKKNKKETIDFEVIYFLTFQSGHPKIFAYITGDEQKALKDKGII